MSFISINSEFSASISKIHFNNRIVFNETSLLIYKCIDRFNMVPNDRFIEDLKMAIETVIDKSDSVHFGELENYLILSIDQASEPNKINFKSYYYDFAFENINSMLSTNTYQFISFQDLPFNPYLEFGLNTNDKEISL